MPPLTRRRPPRKSRIVSRTVRALAGVSLGLLLLPSLPLEADADEYDAPPRNGLKAHAWALEFEVDPRIGGPSGSAIISGKYHMSARSALRLGFLTQISTSDEAANSRTVVDTLVVPRGNLDADNDSQTYNLFAHFVRYASAGSRLNLFGFAGPTVRRNWNRTLTRIRNGSNPDYTIWANETRSRGVGADLGAGFEYFFTRRFSLGARYGLVYLYQDSKTHRSIEDFGGGSTLRQTDDSRSHGFIIQSTPTVVMLSAYF